MRTSFDLSHFAFSCGKIGSLQTLSVIPTLPGDSFDINVAMTFRLAPLRRALSLDAHIDLYAFWIPHRHCYDGQGEDNQFIKFIKQGLDPAGTVKLDTYTLKAP
uniref:major capsid protein n=1 Tax=Thiolapillus sp. TaxID=2017437 RepID=UPI003AF8C5D6